MPRRRDVSSDELGKIIQLRESKTSWLKIQEATGVPRQIAKREYQIWEQNQSRKELKQARIQVATNLFSEHLEQIVRLAETLVNNIPESVPPLETRDAETVVNDILTMCVSSKPEESVSITGLEQESDKAQRRSLRQNQMLFRSLRHHTRENVDWQVLEKWKAGWNTSRQAMEALHPRAEKKVRIVLDQEEQRVKDRIEKTGKGESILCNMVAGAVEVVWRGVNENTLENVADLVQIRQTDGGRGLIVFGTSGSLTRIDLPHCSLAEDVAGICRWVARSLSVEEKEGQIRRYKDGIAMTRESIKELEGMLDPLMLRPMILRTTCDLCPA